MPNRGYSGLLICVIILVIVCANPEELNNDGLQPDNKQSEFKITGDSSLTVEQLYEKSYLSYLDEDYESCHEFFEKTRLRYRDYKFEIARCRRLCQARVRDSKSMFMEYERDMAFYERKIRETLCLLNCARDYEKIHGAGTLSVISPKMQNKLSELDHYAFAHICYFQVNRYKDAANVIYTYLIRHPEDKMSLRYIEHYLSNPEVTKDNLKDLEAYPFVEVYNTAVEEFENGNYDTAMDEFENSLHLYLSDYENCRLYCEGPFDQGWHPEFAMEIANHYTYSLQCKQNCTRWLNTINGQYHDDLFPTHYHYLQFCCYKSGLLDKALAAVASYLLFYPSDQTMLNNKKYYAAMPKFKPEFFTPREEALEYLKRQTLETMLLRFIDTEFKTENDDRGEIEDNEI